LLIHSAADGKTNALAGWANWMGAVGTVASTVSGVSTISSSEMVSGVGSSSGVASGAEAATFSMRACSKAGSATIDSSDQRASATIMVPSLSNENLVGTTPTLTLSYAPMSNSSMVSSAALVLASLAVNIMPSSVDRRSVTMPRTLAGS
jgi:hypothetical protein